MLDAEVRRGEIGLQHRVPVGAFHAHDELIAGDAGVVDQDVDLCRTGRWRFDGGLDLLFVGNIEGEGCGLAARGRDFADQFIQLLPIARGDGDRRAFPGELWSAQLRPMPCDAPVTNATRPERDMNSL